MPAGRHVIVAEYQSLPLKAALFWLGIATLVGLVVVQRRARLAAFRARLSGAHPEAS